MSKPKIVVNTFTNGAAILEFSGEYLPIQIQDFRDMWQEAVDEAARRGRKPLFHFAGMEVVVADHPNPLGGEPVDFDALSHAFGALGWEVEDEEIEALLDRLRAYLTEGAA